MKNFYNKVVLTYLLITIMVFSPLITIAQVVEEISTEEPVAEIEVIEEIETIKEIVEEIDLAPTVDEVEVAEDDSTDPISELVNAVVEDLVDPLLTEQEAPEPIVVEDEGMVRSNFTFVEKVELGITYSHVNNPEVQVTFTKLPENPGSLSIEEVVLTDEQMEAFGSLSDVAYDITSNMENGSFEYDLKLPLPEGVEEVAKVVYAESVEELDLESASVEAEKVEVVSDTVVVSDLDHFTVFVIVPDDLVSRTLIPFNPFVEGWSFQKYGNANINLVSAVSAGISSANGSSHVVKMDRAGGAGTHRAFLGYFEENVTLSDIEELKWSVYSKTGTDTYLNIYLRKNWNETATVVFSPATTPNTWTQNSLVDAGSITVRHNKLIGADTQVTYSTSAFTQLMSSQYATWDLMVDLSARAGIAIVSGSTSPTAAQEHYVDAITLKISGNEQYFDFENLLPEAPVVNFELPTPAQNSYVKGTITGHVVATDNEGMGSYYIRVWKDAFESGISNLVHNSCYEAPGADLLGTSLDKNCVYDTKTNPDGVYVFSAQFLDSDTQWGSALRTFTVDNTKPVATLDNPTPLTTIFNSSDVDFEINATDNFELKRIVGNIYKVGQAGVFKSNQKSINGDSGSFTIDISTLTDGDYYIKYNAEDEAGNIASTGTFNFTIDNTAPTIPSIISPLSEEVFETTPILNEWTESADETDVTYQIAYSYDDGHTFGGSTCPDVTIIDGKSVSGCRDTLSTSRNHTPSLEEQGGVTIWVRAIDAAGNKSEWSEDVHYYYDTTPEVIIEVPTTTPEIIEAEEDSNTRNRRGSRIAPPAALASGGGEVLGASTGLCQMYLNSYMKQGDTGSEVSLLQSFLNDQGITVPVTGYFGPLTRAAVVEFQNKYADEILKPWGVEATGNVYKTTRWKINNVVCEGSEAFPIIP